MNKRCRYVIQALIILLLVGPLQAQQIFQCDMMDATFYDDCCCDDHNNCADSDCDEEADAKEVPCCDKSIELSLNDEAVDISKAIKSLELRTGIDPPAQTILQRDNLFPLNNALAYQSHSNILIHHSGSDAYLVTQRLRI